MLAKLISLMILFACIFDLQYSILIGPFLDVLLLMGLAMIGLIFAITTIINYNNYIEGFVDTEYGYIKALSKEIKESESLSPYGLKNGRYFFIRHKSITTASMV